jgi:hypothetical protein
MAEIRTRRSVLAAKIESVVGTPETLTGAEADNLVMDLKFEPDFSVFERKIMDQSLSSFQPIIGTQKGTVTCKLEVRGSGTAGTAPSWGKFLKACGFKETIVGATSVTYAPDNAATLASLTLGVYRDGLKKLLAGGRGNWKLSASDGEPGMLELAFQGLYSAVTDVSLLVPSGVQTTIPKPFLSAAFQAHSFSAKIHALSIDAGNTIVMREDVSTASGFIAALITERNMKAQIDPEEELVASLDWYGRWKAGTTGNLTFALTGAAGNIVTVTAPKFVFTKISETDRNGLAALTVDGALARSAAGGDDEISIVFT